MGEYCAGTTTSFSFIVLLTDPDIKQSSLVSFLCEKPLKKKNVI